MIGNKQYTKDEYFKKVEETYKLLDNLRKRNPNLEILANTTFSSYNQDKIKVYARMVGREGRNLKEILEKTVNLFKSQNPETIAEVGGHQFAAGCLIEKERESSFIKALKENLEIEIIKI